MPASSSKTDLQRLRGLLSFLCLFLSACAALSDTACCAILQKRPHFESEGGVRGTIKRILDELPDEAMPLVAAKLVEIQATQEKK